MDDTDPNFNQIVFRYGSFWFLLKIHPKWLFNEGFRGPRGVDGFGQFFFEPNRYLPVGNDTKHRQATPFARHMFEEPLNSTEDWRFFHVFSLLWGEWSDSHVDDYMISMISHDPSAYCTLKIAIFSNICSERNSSWKSLHHSSPAPDVQSGMNHVEPLDFSVQQVGRIEVFSSSFNSEMMPSGISSVCMLHWTFSVGKCFFLLATGWHDFPTCEGKLKKKGARTKQRTS